jgi:hypothetical protein
MTDVWDTEAELLASAIGKSLDECRERVILRWMEQGNLRPLRAALLRGWVMGRAVQQYLGSMLLDDNEEYCYIDDPTGRQTSHQLIVRQRGPGNPRKPENFVRDIDLVDPPPLKWSDLRYVFDIKEDCNGKEAIQA